MSTKKINPCDVVLDEEERGILDSFEAGEWQSVADVKKQKALAKRAAENYLNKNSRINIRLSSSDLLAIKEKAAFEGLPYQTLIASILHKYAAGHL